MRLVMTCYFPSHSSTRSYFEVAPVRESQLGFAQVYARELAYRLDFGENAAKMYYLLMHLLSQRPRINITLNKTSCTALSTCGITRDSGLESKDHAILNLYVMAISSEA